MLIVDADHGRAPTRPGGGPVVTVRWVRPDSLEIRFHRRARVFRQAELVGAVKIDRDIRDIRGKNVKAGVYTLRYGIQPANGDHLGVSPFREFLLLCPAAADTDAAARGHDGTIDLSKQTIGGSHPAVWSIDPPSASDAPLAVHTTELGHKALVVEVPVSRGDRAAAGSLRFGIVLIGRIEA